MNFRASKSAVIHGFQAFYYELLRQKEKALSLYFASEQTPELARNAEENDAKNETDKITQKQVEIESTIVAIQKKLISVINDAADAMVAKSQLAQALIADVKYVMTVLADEIFINLRWEGAKYWRLALLERQVFQTEVAGDKFFTLLDEATTNYNKHNDEMFFVYLMALSLGFKGRYRDVDEADVHIAWYKDKLYSLLHTKQTRLFYPGRACIIESCYESTNTESNNSQLPDAKFWSWCVMGVVFVYIVISYVVWFSITSDVSDVLNKIAEQARSGPLI